MLACSSQEGMKWSVSGAFTRTWRRRRRSETGTIMAAMAGSRRCSASPLSLEGERKGALFRFWGFGVGGISVVAHQANPEHVLRYQR